MKYLLIILLLSGCYNSKKANKQIDNAYNKYPVLVAKKASLWFPCIITDSSTVIDTVFNDSSSFYNHTIDSLLKIKSKVKDSLAIRYKDSCRSVYDNFQQGFNLGYEVGFSYGKMGCTSDTIRIRTKITIKDTRELEIINGNYINAQAKISVKNLWLKILGIFAGLGWIIAVILFLVVKRIW